MQVALTAAVVGPPGEEIHVDERGQIKVRFHWDRENGPNGDSSCWLRTMQTWAGPAWGHQFVPRVGMEVIVVFEGGDPDKPMVLGTVYNATHPPSFKLPEEKTRSGIRTQTTPGGNGFNELSFEDGAGREEIFLRAQRDLTEEVTNDRHTMVGSNVHENVGGDKAMSVGKNMRQAITGDHHSFVQGAHYDSVKGNRKIRVRGTYKLQVDSEMALEVGTTDEPRSQEVFTHGNYLLGSAATVTLSASTGVRLQCGSSVLEIGPKEIRLFAENIVLDAQKELTAKGDGPGLRLADVAELTSKTIRFVSEKASIELAQNATIDGKQILMNCKGIAPEVLGKPGAPITKKLNAVFSDQDFEPIAAKDFIAVAGGARFEGTTAGDGSAELRWPRPHADAARIQREHRARGQHERVPGQPARRAGWKHCRLPAPAHPDGRTISKLALERGHGRAGQYERVCRWRVDGASGRPGEMLQRSRRPGNRARHRHQHGLRELTRTLIDTSVAAARRRTTSTPLSSHREPAAGVPGSHTGLSATRASTCSSRGCQFDPCRRTGAHQVPSPS